MPTPKIGCPTCGFENNADALVCAQCYALLRKPEGDPLNTTLTPPFPSPKPVALPGPLSSSDLPALSANALALYIGGRAKPLIVEVPRLAVVGRPSQDGSIQPDIAAPLRANDRLTLGKLDMLVYFA